MIGDSFFSPGLTGSPYSYQRGSMLTMHNQREETEFSETENPRDTQRERERKTKI